MGLDALHLRVLMTSSDDPREREYARKVLRLLERGRHWVLVVLLLGNVVRPPPLLPSLDLWLAIRAFWRVLAAALGGENGADRPRERVRLGRWEPEGGPAARELEAIAPMGRIEPRRPTVSNTRPAHPPSTGPRTTRDGPAARVRARGGRAGVLGGTGPARSWPLARRVGLRGVLRDAQHSRLALLVVLLRAPSLAVLAVSGGAAIGSCV